MSPAWPGACGLRSALALTILVATATLGVALQGDGPAGAEGAADNPVASSELYPLTPARLLDTRDTAKPFGAGESRELAVAGVGNVPAAATAVTVNLTVTNTTGGGFLTAYPAGGDRPTASSINFVRGQTVANAAIVKLGTGGRMALFSNVGPVDVIVDVTGWFGPSGGAGGSRFVAVPPMRVADTRTKRVIPGGEALLIALQSEAPYDKVRAVALNVTVTQPEGGGFLTVTPWDVPLPPVSSLNFTTGQTVANGVVSSLGPLRRIGVFNGSVAAAHEIVDLDGFFMDPAATTGGRFVPLTPTRLLDTRESGAPVTAGSAIELAVAGANGPAGSPAGIPATGVGAVALNVTAVGPTAGSFLTVWPKGFTRPTVSSLNVNSGQVVSNLVQVGVGTDGKVSIYNHAGTLDVVVDVVGWYETAQLVGTAKPAA